MSVVALRNGQNIQYRQWPMHRGLIAHAERPKIVDALLMHISMDGHGTCSYLFSLYWRPILWLYIGTTISLLDYLTYRMKIHWRSVDAHIQNGAGSMWPALLPMKPVNPESMNHLNRSPHRLPMMQDQKLLPLRWRSFCNACIHNMLSFNLDHYIINSVLAACVPSSCTFFFITTLFFNNTYKYIL